MIKKIKRTIYMAFFILMLAASVIIVNVARIYYYSYNPEERKVDAVIVLGAAAWGKKPSPVLRERINHAIVLYRSGLCRFIIFTGGRKVLDEPGEAVISMQYALSQGIPSKDMLMEKESRTTMENLTNVKKIADEKNLKTFIIVSDPYHLKRAAMIAEDIGLEVYPSPTPTSRFRSSEEKFKFILRESYYLFLYELGSFFTDVTSQP